MKLYKSKFQLVSLNAHKTMLLQNYNWICVCSTVYNPVVFLTVRFFILMILYVTQIVTVLLSDFTVLCYNHKLDLLLWSIRLTHNKDISNMVIR